MRRTDDILPAEILEAASTEASPVIVILREMLAGSLSARMVANAVSSVAEQQLAGLEAEAGRWPTLRASKIGSEDNQRHGLSHCHKVFATLDLNPLELLGLEALGLLGLQWRVEAALQNGNAPGPILSRHVLADQAKARVCRLVGAAVSWRHMKAAYEAKVAECVALIARGNTGWRSKSVSAEQHYLLNWIQTLVQADDSSFMLPTPANRGEAFDIIREMGGSPAFRQGTDQQIILLALALIFEIRDGQMHGSAAAFERSEP
jgi:hypothetical protein